ncbi:MAG: hypothetical protein IKQ41_10475 [Clostridia bacterium]|nr:hypothetical protein [Clostridia bacterium]
MKMPSGRRFRFARLFPINDRRAGGGVHPAFPGGSGKKQLLSPVYANDMHRRTGMIGTQETRIKTVNSVIICCVNLIGFAQDTISGKGAI